MSFKSVALGASAALLASYVQASASVVTITYQGTVSDGYDQSGDFGAPNTSLTGDSCTLVFTSDPSKGTLTTSSGPLTSGLSLIQGSGAMSPVSAVLTINGHSFSMFTGLGNDTGTLINSYEGPPNFTVGVHETQQNVTTSGDIVSGTSSDLIIRSVYVDLIGDTSLPVAFDASYDFNNLNSPFSFRGRFQDISNYCDGGSCTYSYDDYASLSATSVMCRRCDSVVGRFSTLCYWPRRVRLAPLAQEENTSGMGNLKKRRDRTA